MSNKAAVFAWKPNQGQGDHINASSFTQPKRQDKISHSALMTGEEKAN